MDAEGKRIAATIAAEEKKTAARRFRYFLIAAFGAWLLLPLWDLVKWLIHD